jgi:outer membrane protein assembly factor BamB
MVNLTEHNVPTEWSVQKGQEKNIKWTADLGSRAYGGPTIANGKIFIGTNNEKPRNPKITGDKGIIMCFRESDGQFLWQAVHDKLESGRVHDWPNEGICSAPLVEGNRLYYVSNRCEVVCADTEGFLDGKNDGAQDEKYKSKIDADFIWRLDMMKELGVFPHNLAVCSPLSVGDVLFVVTANGVDEDHTNIPNPKAPSFIAVDKKTGKVLWQDNSPGTKIMHGQWSNPVYAVVRGKPQVVFPGGDGWIRAFEPQTGRLIWEFDCNPKNSKYELGGKGTRSDFIATPVVHNEKVYIGTGQDPEHADGVGHLWCIDMTKTGDVSPDLVTDAKSDPPKTKPNPNSGAVWHYGGPAQGENLNRDFVFGRTMSTCSVHDGLVYVADLAGYVHCLDAKTGKPKWKEPYDLKANVWGSTYWVDGKVYIGTEDGDVFIFTHGKDPKDEKPRKIEMEHSVKSTPIVCNGVLYVMTETTLYAIEAK